MKQLNFIPEVNEIVLIYNMGIFFFNLHFQMFVVNRKLWHLELGDLWSHILMKSNTAVLLGQWGIVL